MDKKNTSVVAPVSFSAGESVTATKLNAILRNLQESIRKLEALIGDPEDEASPYGTIDSLSQETINEAGATIAAAKKLNIANISRLIGPAEALNPHHMIYPGMADISVKETLPSGATVFSHKLRFHSIDANTLTFADGAETIFVNLVSNPFTASVALASGDYWLNEEQGILYSFDAFDGGSVTYTITEANLGQMENQMGATQNVIPDPNQTIKCTATLQVGTTNHYLIELPAIINQQRNESNDSTALSDEDFNYQENYRLPFVITNSLSAGEDIPGNFIKLKDLTDNRYITGVTYEYVDEFSFIAKGKVLDVGHDFQVVTVGTSITESIKDLYAKVRAIRNGTDEHLRVPSSAIVNDSNLQYREASPGARSNPLPFYLHRNGMRDRSGLSHDASTDGRGGMNGDLLMLKGGNDPDTMEESLTEDSCRIRFGDGTNGPFLGLKGVVGLSSYLQLDLNNTPMTFFELKNGYFISEKGIMAGTGNTNFSLKVVEIDLIAAGHTNPSAGDTISINILAELEKADGSNPSTNDIYSINGILEYENGGVRYAAPLYSELTGLTTLFQSSGFDPSFLINNTTGEMSLAFGALAESLLNGATESILKLTVIYNNN